MRKTPNEPRDLPLVDLAVGAFSVRWFALGAFAMGGLLGGLVAFGAAVRAML